MTNRQRRSLRPSRAPQLQIHSIQPIKLTGSTPVKRRLSHGAPELTQSKKIAGNVAERFNVATKFVLKSMKKLNHRYLLNFYSLWPSSSERWQQNDSPNFILMTDTCSICILAFDFEASQFMRGSGGVSAINPAMTLPRIIQQSDFNLFSLLFYASCIYMTLDESTKSLYVKCTKHLLYTII